MRVRGGARDPAPLSLRWARLCGRVSGSAVAQAETRARAADERLQAVLDALPEGVVFLDADGRYVMWNARYAEIYHRSADLFSRGERLIDTLRIGVERGDYPEALGREQAWLAEREAQLQAPGPRHEQTISDGRCLLLEERRTRDGGLIGLRIDITELKTQALELEAARRRAEGASQAKSDFLANMSHEVRTPLNGVLGAADLLLATPLENGQRSLVQTILNSADGLNRILSDILDITGLEGGAISLDEVEFSLLELLNRSLLSFSAAASDKNIQLKLEYETKLTFVRGDPARIGQIVTKLIGNALKFTEHGVITLRVCSPRGSGPWSLEVMDTGIGFDEALAERLFDRFEQADNSISRKFGGTGLGLAICRKLARLMGGEIVAAGHPGVGACFTVTLPLAAAVAPPSPVSGAQALRVLVADDNPTNLELAKIVISNAGAEVVCVEDGWSAVCAFKTGGFDAVLMDMQMPRMDGLTAIRNIRRYEADQAQARTPIIVVSASVLTPYRDAAQEAGADDYVAKPIRTKLLLEKVHALTAKRDVGPRAPGQTVARVTA